jgi:hypothetical protein
MEVIMSTRFAPTSAITAVRMAIAAALVAVSLFMVLSLNGPATAAASGNTGGSTCSKVVVQIVCIGEINGNTVTVSTGAILSSNDISVLENNLNNVLNNSVNPDTQVEVNNVAVGVVAILKDVLNINICQVKVIELGLINTNIAKCN